MPEGDTVHRLARRLDRRFAGKVIARSDLRVPRFATSDLRGFRVLNARALGKHLLIRMVGPDGEAVTLYSHLRMDGSWRVHDETHKAPRRYPDTVRVVIEFDDGSSLVGHELPVLELIETEKENDVVGHLGPDLLGDFDMEEALRRLRQSPERPIVSALLDQRNLSGIGNVWAVETCFLRGVYPWTPVAQVDLEPMLTLTRKMLRFSLNVVPGMVTTGSRKKGETHWVHGRAGLPCRRCGTPIEYRRAGADPYDRDTWWCPSCQPERDKAER